jgi:hypothetical protein
MYKKEMIGMKKVLVGFIFGIILTASFSAYGDSLIGKTIQNTVPLIIDNQKLANNVIVIEGVSYLPIREASDRFGYDVDYIDQTIYLDKKIEVKKEEEVTSQEVKEDEPVQEPVADLEFVQLPSKIKFQSNNLNLYDHYFNSATEVSYIELDGDIFVNALLFKEYYTWESPTLNLSFPGKESFEVFFHYPQEQIYVDGSNGVYAAGQLYIRLSALGLSVENVDGTLIIEN